MSNKKKNGTALKRFLTNLAWILCPVGAFTGMRFSYRLYGDDSRMFFWVILGLMAPQWFLGFVYRCYEEYHSYEQAEIRAAKARWKAIKGERKALERQQVDLKEKLSRLKQLNDEDCSCERLNSALSVCNLLKKCAEAGVSHRSFQTVDSLAKERKELEQYFNNMADRCKTIGDLDGCVKYLSLVNPNGRTIDLNTVREQQQRQDAKMQEWLAAGKERRNKHKRNKRKIIAIIVLAAVCLIGMSNNLRWLILIKIWKLKAVLKDFLTALTLDFLFSTL